MIIKNDLRIVEQVDLLTYWIKTCKITSIKEVSLMDKAYCLMSPADLDALCECMGKRHQKTMEQNRNEVMLTNTE